MTTLIIGSVLSFAITLILLPFLIQFAAEKKIFVARQFRKVHSKDVSALGGIAIFAAVFFVMLFFSEFMDKKTIRYYLAAGSFIFLIGLRDDLRNVRPWIKLLGQSIAALIIIFPGNVRIDHIYLINGSIDLNLVSSAVITLFIVILFINSYNFFDGIDMQAAITAMVVMLPAGIWFYQMSQENFGLLLISTSASLLAFLIFNYSPSRIFMGDTGTVTIGFILAFAFIKFSNLMIDDNSPNPIIHFPLLFGFTAFQLPIFDAFRVVFWRLLKKRNPMQADKNHFHHLLLKAGWKQKQIAYLAGSYTLITLIFNYYFFTNSLSFYLLIAINILFLSTLYGFVFFRISQKSKLKSP
ncbi:MAG: undecaprenyl/decaprenyl-phosphate alpha-N-acetylglucosaminyl 1-phosphate transferase [Bacteroidales bacterium]|nr:undecaprenyl/decaprenyl-phosphate alpha-N-acetylglucosaminyl 1-phosphate transferase [Bacteroidales bacterium]